MSIRIRGIPGLSPSIAKLRWPGNNARWFTKVRFYVALLECEPHEGTRNVALGLIERLLCE